MHTAPLLASRASPDATLTITRAQLCDAVQRALLCQAPAITQGIWNVLQDEAQRAADEAAARRVAEGVAAARAAHQTRLEQAFAGVAR